MTQTEFIYRRNAYKSRAAIAAIVALLALMFGVGFVVGHTNGLAAVVLFWACIFFPVLGYGVFARWLAKRMGLFCSHCGRRILSSADVTAGRCSHCGGACVDSSA
jgi:predicted membrane protein